MAEKRVSQRRQMERRCWVALEPTQSLAECFLSDISNTGAKLVLQTESKIPTTFDLYLTPDGHVGRKCKVVWQSGKEIGVKFVGRAVPHRTSESVETPLVIEGYGPNNLRSSVQKDFCNTIKSKADIAD